MKTFNRSLALEMVGNEEELLLELELSFINDKIFQLSVLEKLEAENPLEAASYVHSFKGPARQLAAEKAAFNGQMLEDVLRGKKTGNLEKLNAEFQASLQEAVNEMKKDTENFKNS